MSASANTASPLDAVLRIPLLWKLAGASIVIAAAAIGAVFEVEPSAAREPLVLVSLLVIAASVAVHAVLVTVAVRPLQDLEETAARVQHGDLGARVPSSRFADKQMRHVADTVNLLLDGLASEQARMRLLALQTIHATEAERSRIGRELHDSAAQQIAALMYQLSAAARDNQSSELAPKLDAMRIAAGDVMEELRVLSSTVHSRVLEDLGLVAALEALARSARAHDATVILSVDPAANALPHDIAVLTHAIVEEVLRTAQPRGPAALIDIVLSVSEQSASLRVRDDGVGFAPRHEDEGRFFALRERVALADGIFYLDSSPGRSALLTVTIPLKPERTSS